ncbi:MAG: hypothetical protein IAG13_20090, partial [Deltaproteobacteria bacterium]|nr:hypothetical protein [Nannocystaceae bacterium]
MADDRDPVDPGAPPEPATDPDRAAILARRQRFIAIALSGLASGSACSKPQPCLNVISVDEGSNADAGKAEDDGKAESDTAPPQACLKVGVPPDSGGTPSPDTVGPQPCLDVAPPPGDTAS